MFLFEELNEESTERERRYWRGCGGECGRGGGHGRWRGRGGGRTTGRGGNGGSGKMRTGNGES